MTVPSAHRQSPPQTISSASRSLTYTLPLRIARIERSIKTTPHYRSYPLYLPYVYTLLLLYYVLTVSSRQRRYAERFYDRFIHSKGYTDSTELIIYAPYLVYKFTYLKV